MAPLAPLATPMARKQHFWHMEKACGFQSLQ